MEDLSGLLVFFRLAKLMGIVEIVNLHLAYRTYDEVQNAMIRVERYLSNMSIMSILKKLTPTKDSVEYYIAIEGMYLDPIKDMHDIMQIITVTKPIEASMDIFRHAGKDVLIQNRTD